jgi:hypothetical protein
LRFTLFLIGLFLFPLFTNAKKLDSLKFAQHKEFFFSWDNDLFLFTDQYYTQGAHFYWINPVLRKNPLNHLFLKPVNTDNYYGLGLIQEMFTPKDILDSLLNTIDRPYAGTLFLRSFMVASSPVYKFKLTYQLDLGILGPLSGATQAQRLIHEWTGSKPPGGWDFQIENRPYINYNVVAEKQLLQFQEIFDLSGISQLRLGNIHDDLSVGANLRIGRMNSHFKGLNFGNKKYPENKDFQLFFFGGAGITGVLYNATLMGGIVPPETSRYFEFREIEHFVGEFNGGAILTYKSVSIKGMLTWKTQEFQYGESHGWGTISMYFRL